MPKREFVMDVEKVAESKVDQQFQGSEEMIFEKELMSKELQGSEESKITLSK